MFRRVRLCWLLLSSSCILPKDLCSMSSLHYLKSTKTYKRYGHIQKIISSNLSSKSVSYTSAGATALGLDSNPQSRKKKKTSTQPQRPQRKKKHTSTSKHRTLMKKNSIMRECVRSQRSRPINLYLLTCPKRLCKEKLSAHRIFLVTSESRCTRKIDLRSKIRIFLLIGIHSTRHKWLRTRPRRLLRKP